MSQKADGFNTCETKLLEISSSLLAGVSMTGPLGKVIAETKT